MIRKFISFAAGWRTGTAEEYSACYHRYGGSFVTHPDVLSFMQRQFNLSHKYYIKRAANRELIGGLCINDNKEIAIVGKRSKALGLDRFPFNKDEMILPISEQVKTVIPYRSKILSSINGRSVLNSTFSLNSHREICLAKSCGKGGFSSSTKNSRNRELKKFLKSGGEAVEQSQLTPAQLVDIYFDLHGKRWGKDPGNQSQMLAMLTDLRDMIFGYVLFYHGKPCAYQLITKTESPRWICFDYVNGGYDRQHDEFCPGTIVTWLNVRAAYELCEQAGKEMRYSFGKPTAAYKDRWCKRAPLGRTLAI
ncbi:GNAT family N-acetyltransferase [Serratia rubidaea]|uniref:GNAT family N-acetyltransferase n=3 Tax=Serratia rubidaea TaxID=61652 RepID=A0ABS0MI84_SERRU|nr:GNAT family N-acetyltransferase [Serratia rubidaea]